MGRKVESGRDGVLAGGALAQDMVYQWIMNDQPMLEWARNVIEGRDGFRSNLRPAERVQALIESILYKDDGSTYRSLWRRFYGERFAASGFESRRINMVRSDFLRADFDKIDWAGLVGDIREEDGE
jgi:hypothetical protein